MVRSTLTRRGALLCATAQMSCARLATRVLCAALEWWRLQVIQ